MGKPSLSDPPVICNLCPDKPTIAPSTISPSLLLIKGTARVPSNSKTLDLLSKGSETITLNLAMLETLLSYAQALFRHNRRQPSIY
jgi:hypothetical protein